MRADASLQNQTLCMDLWLVAKQIRKSAPKFMQVSKVVNYAYTVDLWSVYVDLHWVAKWWKTCVDLRTNLSSTKVNASQCKSKQVGGQMKCKSNASQKLALTCKSIWPGLKLKTKKPQWTYMQAACYVTDIPPGVLLVLESKPHLC